MSALRILLISLAALLVQTLFFLIIPVINALFSPLPIREQSEAQAVSQLEIAMLKPVDQQHQKEIKPLNTTLKIQSPRSISGPPRGFSMDLSLAIAGAGEGSGVAVAIGSGAGVNVIYNSGQVDEMASELRSAQVTYPQRALRERKSGRVELLLVVESDGSVSSLETIAEDPSGYGFATAALEAMKKYLFKPAKLDGISVRQRYSKEFFFDPP